MSNAAGLIKSLNLRGSSEAMRKFTDVFKDIISKLSDADIDYAIIGAVAYGQYHPNPRSTSDIDFMIYSDDRDEFLDLMSEYDLVEEDESHYILKVVRDSTKMKTIDFLFTVGFAPDNYAIDSARSLQIFGVRNVKVASPESLVALWLQSASGGIEKSYLDAKEFISKKLVNIKKVREIISDSMDNSLGELLDNAIAGKSIAGESLNIITWSEMQRKRKSMYSESNKSPRLPKSKVLLFNSMYDINQSGYDY